MKGYKLDYHSNIFYYYGKDELTAESEVQLENNTTKALINTLQYSSPALTSHFLSNVLNKKVDAKVFKFHLQSEKSSQELQNAIKNAKAFLCFSNNPKR